MTGFLVIKLIHISTVFITAGLFLLRLIWMLRESSLLQQRWVKVLPHVNDSLLLASGISMAVLIHQYPFSESWLTAKLVALVFYVIFGSIALKRGRTLLIRRSAALIALLCFAYILAVALNRSPLPVP